MKSLQSQATFRFAGILLVIAFVAPQTKSQASPSPAYVFGQTRFGGSSGSLSIAKGDFNGDGIQDFVLTNHDANTISIVLGKRDGTFQPPVSFATGAGPTLVTSADFNNDGKLDLAVVFTHFNSCCGGVSILLGQGNGTFASHVDYGVGAVPVAIVGGDFNADKNFDLAIVNQGAPNSLQTGEISLLLGRGDGTLQPQIFSPAGPMPQSMVAGDFDGDGKLDLLVQDFALQQRPGIPSGGGIALLRGKGDGKFQPPLMVYLGPADDGQLAGLLAVGDFNGDKKLDIAVTSQFPLVFLAILPGNGDGTFGAGNLYFSDVFQASAIVAGDFHGSGKLDLALGGISGVSLLTGNGDGSFGPPVTYGGGANVSSLVTADVNGDNKLDVAYADTAGLGVILGNGDGTLGTPPKDYFAGTNVSAIAEADFNADGKSDIAMLNTNFTSATTVSILLNNGDGTFAPRKTSTISGPVTSNVGALTAADFNNDGKLDLAVKVSQANNILILLGKGDGSFQSPVTYPTGAGSGSFTLGDFNRDGKLDLAVINRGDSTVSILLGNGDGTFQPQKVLSAGPNPVGLAAGDLNKDGRLDLVVTNGGLVNGQPSNASVFLGNGDGTFKPAVPYLLGGAPGSVAIGDFNVDGNLDLAVSDSVGISILLGKGDGTFQPHVDYAARVGRLFATDFNGDGKLDLITSGASILLGRGDGTFQPAVNFNLPSFPVPTDLVVADFNDDGASDFVIARSDGNGNSSATAFLNSPVAALHPSTLRFSAGNIGSTSASQTVVLSNPGSVRLRNIGISTAGDFAELNSCGTQLLSNAHCDITVTFTPKAAGTRTGQLVIADNAPGASQSIPLLGTGSTTGPIAILSTTTLAFGTQVIGVVSSPQTVTLNNPGNVPLTISGISARGDYTPSNNCGSSLAAGASCTITVTLLPTAKDSRPGTLTIADNAPGSPHVVNLTGTGTFAQLSAGTLNFGNQPVGTRGGSQTVTLTNRGSFPLTISNILPSKTPGDFLVTNTCGTTLQPGANCTIKVTFQPLAKGPRTESIFILDDGGSSPQKILLAGTGI